MVKLTIKLITKNQLDVSDVSKHTFSKVNTSRGWMDPSPPGVFDMLQYFETILASVVSL